MLKITPYLGILVVIVSIGGLFYPKLGYFLLLVFATLMLTSSFLGRWFCGNLCPRGSYHDFWLSKISRKRSIPKTLRSMWIRIPLFMLLMGFMIYRLTTTKGIIDKIGVVFVIMCLASTIISTLLAIHISPRAWCTMCPMGTLQRWFDRGKHVLKTDMKRCIDCKICHKVCPMHLKVNEITHKPDCIKCSRCIEACPKKALSW